LSAIYNPILILHPSDTQMAKSGSPMKLFEYASLNLPMVVGNSIQQQASKLNGVVFYQSGNSEDLLNTLTSVTKDYQSYYQQSQKLRQSVMENYTWSKIVADWLKNLDK
jgi:glycosyltransferase involved in cell wall biosynthesis